MKGRKDCNGFFVNAEEETLLAVNYPANTTLRNDPVSLCRPCR
jgi:hypothetical protein